MATVEATNCVQSIAKEAADVITLHPEFMRENLKSAKENGLIEDFIEFSDGTFSVRPKQSLRWIELNQTITLEQDSSQAVAEKWVCPLCRTPWGTRQYLKSDKHLYFQCYTCGYKDSRFYDYR
jgi:hypothetical protein